MHDGNLLFNVIKSVENFNIGIIPNLKQGGKNNNGYRLKVGPRCYNSYTHKS